MRKRWLEVFTFISCAIQESHVFVDEGERDVASGAVTLFCDDEFGFALLFFFVFFGFRIVSGASKKAYKIGILLDGAGFTKVGDSGTTGSCARFTSSGFRVPVELSEYDDGDVELLSDTFYAC